MSRFEVFLLFFFIGAAVANVVPLENKTVCQLERERELKSTVTVKLVPECDANGDYVPLACYYGKNGAKLCSCFTKQGNVAKALSADVERCECHVERYGGQNPPRRGSFIPTCLENGNYAKLQCWGSTGMCWCSHPDGKKKTEPTRSRPVKCE